MAIATAMYYTGIDPLTNEPVYTATDLREKRMMKALTLLVGSAAHPLAREALRKAGRSDLIGRGPQHLVPPDYGVSTPVAPGRGARDFGPNESVSPGAPGKVARSPALSGRPGSSPVKSRASSEFAQRIVVITGAASGNWASHGAGVCARGGPSFSCVICRAPTWAG